MEKDYMVFDGSHQFDIGRFKSRVKESGLSKDNYQPVMAKNRELMAALQDKFYAHGKDSILILFQAMDAAGKDGMIKHVMSGLNPQGTQVTSFKEPSKEELNHDYLWRCMRALPERGKIGIFNRSYYEDVLIAKVHDLPFLQQKLPERCLKDDIWEKRYRQIGDFERYLSENGIIVLKFFLHVSKEEQKKRFLERIDNESKNWKFSSSDIAERQYWHSYQKAYEDAVNKTASDHAPWFVIPADAKWYARIAVSEIIIEALRFTKPDYPRLAAREYQMLDDCKRKLLSEE